MQNEPQDAYLPNSDKETLEPFDVREQNSRRGMYMLLAFIVGLLLLAFVISRLFSAGTRSRDDTPRILADNRPYKEVPIDRGGVQTPNQDKEIYDKINGKGESETVTLTPSAETPLAKPAANVVIKAPEVKKPAVTTSSVAKSIAKPKPKETPKPAVKDGYAVVVASLRSEAEAGAMWDRLKVKMGDVVSPTYHEDIKRVDLGDRGVFYRLRIVGAGSKANATQLCKKLKARSQDCFVTAQ